ncbi:MAG: S1C family serine protease [Ktedonobacterales bacterium]
MSDSTASASSPSASANLAAWSEALAGVVQDAGRYIVTIAARPRQPATGILWSAGSETIVLTAEHVVEREDDIRVTLPDGTTSVAQIIGRDPSTDLVALRLANLPQGTALAAAPVSHQLRVGNLALAIGRPGPDGLRVSFGVVSAIEGPRRSWQGGEIEGVIYPDLTLYPGFSGGPLVDLAGNVVGLNSSHLTRQNSSAIPVATLIRVANTLVTHGKVRRGYLGIGTQQVPLSPALAQSAGLSQETALLIVSVEAGSPAEQAGLLIGDQLVGINGQPVPDVEGLRSRLGSEPLGQAVALKLLRGGAPVEMSVTLGERP